jgi:hypothetical protein
MALIYRSIFDIEDGETRFVDRAPERTLDWLRWKGERTGLDLSSLDLVSGTQELGHGLELTCGEAANSDCAVFRVALYEGARDDSTQVKTTFTALTGTSGSSAWVDLERWVVGDTARSWVPGAPGIVGTLVTNESALAGSLALERRPRMLDGKEGALLADLVVDEARVVPIIVVSYNKREADFLAAAENRGWEIAKRLAGIAVVRVLGEGAVSAFSRAMHEAVGPDFDVHSGAIRVYLPGLATSRVSPGSHRFIPPRRLEGRDPELAALMIAPPLFRRATESPPPSLWLEHGRALFSTTLSAEGLDALLEEADEEIKGLRRTAVDLERELADARQDVLDLARQLDDLGRRNAYLRQQLRTSAPGADAEPPPVEFQPEFCSEVVEHAAEHFPRVEVHPSIMSGAEALDEHADESWARKAWLAFRALHAYSEAKAIGEFDGDFKSCCEQSAVDTIIPSSWVARNETKMTMANDRFRELRILPVSTEIDPNGRILMEQHIKIEQGGNPAPRIHYYDDTRGSTRKIHIGWFGPHLDSWAKS